MRSTNYPCVAAKMGDWAYYTTVMKMSDIIEQIKFAEEVCPNKDLDFMIQREVSSRSKEIADYLQQNDQRFFGALIIAAYDGAPKFLPIAFESQLIGELEGKLGILRFDGTEQYYAIDGQHRLAAMKQAHSMGPNRYKNDEVSIIVVCHTKDRAGMARARRLFTTVNRYARKTSPVTNIVMDEDDGYAITVRRLLRENDFFSKRIKIKNKNDKLAKNEAMSLADKEYLMAIGTFYKCSKNLLPPKLAPYFSKPQQMPSYEILEKAHISLQKRWEILIGAIDFWGELKNPNANLITKRTKHGGHILARPIGITAFTNALGKLWGDSESKPEEIKKCIDTWKDINMSPWRGLLWNPSAGKMFSGKERGALAGEIWQYLFGLKNIDMAGIEKRWREFVDPQHEHHDLKLPSR